MDAVAEVAQPTLVRLDEVMRRTGLGRSAIYAKIKDSEFPAPIKLGDRASAWVESEITAWINHRITQSRSAQPRGPGADLQTALPRTA